MAKKPKIYEDTFPNLGSDIGELLHPGGPLGAGVGHGLEWRQPEHQAGTEAGFELADAGAKENVGELYDAARRYLGRPKIAGMPDTYLTSPDKMPSMDETQIQGSAGDTAVGLYTPDERRVDLSTSLIPSLNDPEGRGPYGSQVAMHEFVHSAQPAYMSPKNSEGGAELMSELLLPDVMDKAGYDIPEENYAPPETWAYPEEREHVLENKSPKWILGGQTGVHPDNDLIEAAKRRLLGLTSFQTPWGMK